VVAPDVAAFSPEKLTEMYATMVRIRAFEAELSGHGDRYKQVFVMTSGMEAIATGVCAVMAPDDYLLSTHRTQAHCIARGVRLDRMLAEILYKATGYCKGHGGRQHMAVLDMGIVGGTGIVGANVAIACGVGMTCKMEHPDRVAVCILGDGASTTGAFHEGLGLAAIWDLPIVYVIENNQYAGYIPVAGQSKLEKLSDRARGYGIPGVTVDGTDVIAVAEATRAAIERARSGGGPTLIEAITLVMGGGTVTNEGRQWRTAAQMAEWSSRDPIGQLRRRLLADGMASDGDLRAIDEAAATEAAEATAFAAASPEPDPAQALSDLYYSGPRAGSPAAAAHA
jgi:TPP-dependent pyruvate/acetoin dehydrogenase alpha subunit